MFKNIKTEFKKIHWLTKDEAISNTRIVIITSFIVSGILFSMDTFINGIVNIF